MNHSMTTANELLEEWFSKPLSDHWFNSTPDIDHYLKTKYQTLWQSARDSKLAHWQDTATGSLALVIIMDQLPLNMFRGEPESFSTEQQAINVSKLAISNGFHHQITPQQQAFLYLPLMHSENIEDQDLSVTLFQQAGLEANLRFARHHRDIIKRFGRFPHRNQILGRHSTAEETDYLNSREAFTG